MFKKYTGTNKEETIPKEGLHILDIPEALRFPELREILWDIEKYHKSQDYQTAKALLQVLTDKAAETAKQVYGTEEVTGNWADGTEYTVRKAKPGTANTENPAIDILETELQKITAEMDSSFCVYSPTYYQDDQKRKSRYSAIQNVIKKLMESQLLESIEKNKGKADDNLSTEEDLKNMTLPALKLYVQYLEGKVLQTTAANIAGTAQNGADIWKITVTPLNADITLTPSSKSEAQEKQGEEWEANHNGTKPDKKWVTFCNTLTEEYNCLMSLGYTKNKAEQESITKFINTIRYKKEKQFIID